MSRRKTKEKDALHGELGELKQVPPPSRAIRDVRIAKGLSLRALSSLAGLPYSTLSKLENGKMTLTYDKLIRLAQALNVDIKDLLANVHETAAPVAIGRRSITLAGEAPGPESEKHVHHYPAADLLGKMMTPIIIDVQARSVDELGGLVRHSGEEYLYVLRGSMELHSDLYAPLPLGPGDSIYFDSGMAHGYVRTSAEPCTVLAVCAGQGIQQLAETASKRLRLSEQHTGRPR
jgi:transcriptional regulator with XRE-family HTH domain